MTLRDAFGVVSQSVAGGETIVGVTVCVRFLFTRLYTHFRANAFVEKLLFYSATPTTRTAVSRIRSMLLRIGVGIESALQTAVLQIVLEIQIAVIRVFAH